jgi:hypothetical protein
MEALNPGEGESGRWYWLGQGRERSRQAVLLAVVERLQWLARARNPGSQQAGCSQIWPRMNGARGRKKNSLIFLPKLAFG